MNDDIDIAAVDFTITFERSQVIDFLPVMLESFIQIFIANPSDRKNWNAFVEPVTPYGWLGVLAFLVLVPPIICCVFFYGTSFISNVIKIFIEAY